MHRDRAKLGFADAPLPLSNAKERSTSFETNGLQDRSFVELAPCNVMEYIAEATEDISTPMNLHCSCRKANILQLT